jgi:regulator of RNase E activity RraB
MSDTDYDLTRFNEEWAEDQNVLRNLAENGDDPSISRAVDVSFRGDIDALEALAEASPEYGFAILEWAPDEEDGPCLYLDRPQTVEAEAIKELTITCLRIERRFGVEYDGWGCMAQDGDEE